MTEAQVKFCEDTPSPVLSNVAQFTMNSVCVQFYYLGVCRHIEIKTERANLGARTHQLSTNVQDEMSTTVVDEMSTIVVDEMSTTVVDGISTTVVDNSATGFRAR